jgi:uncharacterized membrane protein YoaK (UPF0700 family)
MPSPPERTRVVILVALTFVTGSVDAVSYLGLDRVFTANMTGNVAMLGFALSGEHGLPLLRTGAALLAFVVGAVVAGRAVRAADARAVWPAPVMAVTAVAGAILLVVCVTWMGSTAPAQAEVTASALAFAMGMQGAATRKLGVADLPTTVITSTLTGLAADSTLAGGGGTRWQRRLAALTALVTGALCGGLLVQISPAYGLLPAIAILAAVTGVIAVTRSHVARDAADVVLSTS